MKYYIINRIETGITFTAGLIYGLQHYYDVKSMEFASAVSALKHTYEGDVNFSSINEFLGILDENITVLLVTNLKS